MQCITVLCIAFIKSTPEIIYVNRTIEPMQNIGEMYMNNVTGVYIPDCAYLVDTRGRNIENINTTDKHESCHALVNENWEHFCNIYAAYAVTES